MTSTKIKAFTHKDFYLPSLNFNFHVWDHPTTTLHTHSDFYEIFFVTKGPIHYTINGKKVILNEKDLSIIRPSDLHVFHQATPNKKTQHVNIACRSEYFQLLTASIHPALLHKIDTSADYIIVPLSDSDYRHLNFLKRKVNLCPSDDIAQKNTAINLLFFNALSIFALNTPSENSYPKWLSALLQNVSSPDFINKSTNDLYALCPYSIPVVIKTFKQYLHMTPVEFLTKMKINYACNLLTNTDYSTATIAQKLGYASLSHFNHVFKKIKNATPSQYRNNAI